MTLQETETLTTAWPMRRVACYTVNWEIVLFGVAEYVTYDNWVGVRQADGRLDQWPVEQCKLLG